MRNFLNKEKKKNHLYTVTKSELSTMTYGWEYATEMTLSPHCRGGLSEMPAVVTKIPKALGPPRRNSSWKKKKMLF